MSQSSARAFPRPFAEEDAASDHRIKIYKYKARLSADEPAAASDFERAALEQERAAQRHPRWRDGGSR